MPIVAEHSGPKMRGFPWWMLAVLLMVFPAGLFVWSFHRPVSIKFGSRYVGFGWLPGGNDGTMPNFVSGREGQGTWGLYIDVSGTRD